MEHLLFLLTNKFVICLRTFHFYITWVFYNSSKFSVPKWILIILWLKDKGSVFSFYLTKALKRFVQKGIRNYVNTMCLIIILQSNAQESSRISGSPPHTPRKFFLWSRQVQYVRRWGCRMRRMSIWKLLCEAGVLMAAPRSSGLQWSWWPVPPRTRLEGLV